MIRKCFLLFGCLIAVLSTPFIVYAGTNERPPMNLSATELLAYSTVRIEVTLADGRKGTGTGFFFNLLENGDQAVPVIITNRHVVAGAKKGLFFMTLADDKGFPLTAKSDSISIDDFDKYWVGHPNPQVDLVAMPIAPLLNGAAQRGLHLFYIGLDKSLIPTEKDLSELTAVEEIIIIGYPTGLWDSVNNFPIFRRGITATHPAKDYNGKKEFVIDAACFPGSSGSPVLLCNLGSYAMRNGGIAIGNRIKLLGILYGGPQYAATGEIVVEDIPSRQVPISLSRIPTNLGYVIKSQAILDFEEIFKPLLKK